MARWQAYRLVVEDREHVSDLGAWVSRVRTWVPVGAMLHAPDRRTALMVSVDLWPDYWYTDALEVRSVASQEAA